MLLAKMLLGPQQSLIYKNMTASSGRGWLRGFKRNMATKKDQSIEFSPVKGAQKAEPVLPTTPQQIPHVGFLIIYCLLYFFLSINCKDKG